MSETVTDYHRKVERRYWSKDDSQTFKRSKMLSVFQRITDTPTADGSDKTEACSPAVKLFTYRKKMYFRNTRS